MQNSTSSLQHLHNSPSSLTRKYEESNAPGSKRKAYTPVTKTEKNKPQESFVVYKRIKDSRLIQQDNRTDITSHTGTPSSMVAIEKPLQHSHQKVSREYNKV